MAPSPPPSPPYHLLQRPRPHLQHGDRTGVPQMCPASGILGGHGRPQAAGETRIPGAWAQGSRPHGGGVQGCVRTSPTSCESRGCPFGEPEDLGGQMGGCWRGQDSGAMGPLSGEQTFQAHEAQGKARVLTPWGSLLLLHPACAPGVTGEGRGARPPRSPRDPGGNCWNPAERQAVLTAPRFHLCLSDEISSLRTGLPDTSPGGHIRSHDICPAHGGSGLRQRLAASSQWGLTPLPPGAQLAHQHEDCLVCLSPEPGAAAGAEAPPVRAAPGRRGSASWGWGAHRSRRQSWFQAWSWAAGSRWGPFAERSTAGSSGRK